MREDGMARKGINCDIIEWKDKAYCADPIR